jgi:hypothetical protein
MLLPPAIFFVCTPLILFVVAGANVAGAAALAVTAAALQSAACVATAESTSAVEAVAETAVNAASHVAVDAASGARLPGLLVEQRRLAQLAHLNPFHTSPIAEGEERERGWGGGQQELRGEFLSQRELRAD